jgi:hypothetical protein
MFYAWSQTYGSIILTAWEIIHQLDFKKTTDALDSDKVSLWRLLLTSRV